MSKSGRGQTGRHQLALYDRLIEFIKSGENAMTDSLLPIYTCDGCDQPIQGEHIMTPYSSGWHGFGEVPPEAKDKARQKKI
ncbi:MAG: hypothetical protein CVV27_03855 [Candidatus Melainabacteria bacterium HGW-Melainabacteria-1]|nr:MAG: hypothetical protein CVV27_03855 [Candidatus Melainabacteria bacterium HGW-Melainabacteria-1]